MHLAVHFSSGDVLEGGIDSQQKSHPSEVGKENVKS